jgi:hypothetical protein
MPEGLKIRDKDHLSEDQAWIAGVEADDATNKDEDSDDESGDLYNEMDPNKIRENTEYDNQDIIEDNNNHHDTQQNILDEDSDDDDEDSEDEEPDNNNNEKDDNDRSVTRSGTITKPPKKLSL